MTLEDLILKRIIIDKVKQEIPICRKCIAYNCKFKNTSEEACGLSEKFSINYINTTFNSIKFKNQDRFINEYIESVKILTNFVYEFEIWKGLILDNRLIKQFVGFHLNANSKYTIGFIKKLANYLDIYNRINDVTMDFKYKIFVEGESDAKCLSRLTFKTFELFFGGDWNILNIEGGGNVKNLEFLLKNYKENNIKPYFMLDRGDDGHGKLIDKLHEKKVIDKNEDDFSFKVCLENSFPAQVIYDSLLDIFPNSNEFIDFDFIEKKLMKKENIVKSIDKVLYQKIHQKLKDNKIKFAESLADNLSKDYNKYHNKRIEIILLLKKLKKNISQQRYNFFQG